MIHPNATNAREIPDDFEDTEAWFAALAYQIPVNDINKLLQQVTWEVVRRRLDGPDVDFYLNRRPEDYATGWQTACEEIAASDAAIDALPEDGVDEAKTIADVLDDVRVEHRRLTNKNKAAFLSNGACSEELRSKLWASSGRSDCLREAIELCRFDSELSSPEVADVLRRHDSVFAMREYRSLQIRTQQADLLNFVLSGGAI